MAKIQKEPDFYPFRIKDHGWVLKNGASIEEIGNAFRDIVYQLVSKDFQKGSVAELMYNDAVSMMQANSDKARKAANARWGNSNTDDEPNGEISGAEAVKLLNSRRNSRCPSSRAEFHNFVYDENLHQGFAEEWFDIHEKREWKTKDGKPISNWKGALKRYCESREKDDG